MKKKISLETFTRSANFLLKIIFLFFFLFCFKNQIFIEYYFFIHFVTKCIKINGKKKKKEILLEML